MKFNIFLILCYFMSSLGISYSYHWKTIPNKNHLHTTYRSAKVLANNDTDCFCIENKPEFPPIIEKLSSNGNGVERLVLYLYKDGVTNEITMYTPSADKQRLIPDLPFEPEDISKTITTETVNDLSKSPYFVAIREPKRLATVDDNATSLSKELANLTEPSIMHAPIGTGKGKLVKTTAGISPISQLQVSKFTSPLSGNFKENNYNPMLHGPATGANNDDVPKIIFTPYLTDTVAQYGPSSNDKVYGGIDENGYMSHSPSPLTEWLNSQIKNVFTHEAIGSNIIDITVLKQLIEKMIIKNGMTISEKGVLTDMSGNVLDMTNLKLRPILFGDSVDYKNFMAQNHMKIRADMPYLQSVMVFLVHPPKILGIIPLRRIYLPMEADSLLYECTSENGCVGQPYSNEKTYKTDKILLQLGDVNTKKEKYNIPKTTKTDIIKKPTASKTENVKDSSKTLKKENPIIILQKKDISDLKKESMAKQSRPLEVNELETLVGALDDLLRTGSKIDQTGKKTSDSEYEDYPFFRIIGGNAATSSGSPISNRGRSGSIDE